MPEAEIGDLIIEVRSATAGVGSFTYTFDHMAELTGRTADQIVAAMEEKGIPVTLEAKIQELIELCNVLSRENRALRAQQQNWTTERAKLIEKNELAKSRVESMITRLKALEQD